MESRKLKVWRARHDSSDKADAVRVVQAPLATWAPWSRIRREVDMRADQLWAMTHRTRGRARYARATTARRRSRRFGDDSARSPRCAKTVAGPNKVVTPTVQ